MSHSNFLSLILQSSPFAQFILLLLCLLLYLTIWYILRKRLAIRRTNHYCDKFEKLFWSGIEHEELAHTVSEEKFGRAALGAIFLSGHHEIEKNHKANITDPEVIVDNVRRAMTRIGREESDRLNRHMLFLATVASTSPYIGLLGTVWGIINAFRSLTETSQATIAQVAPGIAEALVATAMGLAAAIPALIAYNYYNGHIERIINRYEGFIDQYCNILRRSI